jgi:hypothetical protein
MNVIDVVRILTIMTPFLAAIALRLPLKKMPRWQRQLGFTASTLTGLLALALFLGGGFYSCTLAPVQITVFGKE